MGKSNITVTYGKGGKHESNFTVCIVECITLQLCAVAPHIELPLRSLFGVLQLRLKSADFKKSTHNGDSRTIIQEIWRFGRCQG